MTQLNHQLPYPFNNVEFQAYDLYLPHHSQPYLLFFFQMQPIQQEDSQGDQKAQPEQPSDTKPQSKRLLYISITMIVILVVGGIATGIYFALAKMDDPNPSPANILNRSESYNFNSTVCQWSHNQTHSEGQKCMMTQSSIDKMTIKKDGNISSVALSLSEFKTYDMVYNSETNETSYILQVEQKYLTLRRLLEESNNLTDQIPTEEINEICVVYYDYDEDQKKTQNIKIPIGAPDICVQTLVSAEHHTTFESLPSRVSAEAQGRKVLQGDVQKTYQVGDVLNPYQVGNAQFIKKLDFQQLEGGHKIAKVEIGPSQYIGGTSEDEIQKNYHLSQTSVMDKDSKLQNSSIEANRTVIMSMESQNTSQSNVLEITSKSNLTLENEEENNENLGKFWRTVEQLQTLETYDLQNITNRMTEPQSESEQPDFKSDTEQSDFDQQEVEDGMRRNLQKEQFEVFVKKRLTSATVIGVQFYLTSLATKIKDDDWLKIQLYFGVGSSELYQKILTYELDCGKKYDKNDDGSYWKNQLTKIKEFAKRLSKPRQLMKPIKVLVLGYPVFINVNAMLNLDVDSKFDFGSKSFTLMPFFAPQVQATATVYFALINIKVGLAGNLFRIQNDNKFTLVFDKETDNFIAIDYKNSIILKAIYLELFADYQFLTVSWRRKKFCRWCPRIWLPYITWSGWKNAFRLDLTKPLVTSTQVIWEQTLKLR